MPFKRSYIAAGARQLICTVGPQRSAGGNAMVRRVSEDPHHDYSPNRDVVLDALGDPGCRQIMHHLTEPMTARELTETCEMPQSTIYRKLQRLSEAGLVEELPSLQPSDSGANQYAIAFEQLTIERSEMEGFEVELTRRERSAEERLAEMWSQMGEET